MLPYVPGTTVKIALTTLGVALPSVIFVISNAVVGEITPPAQRGALLAIGTAVASSGGLLAPYVMGSVIERATTPLRVQHGLLHMRGPGTGGRDRGAGRRVRRVRV
jgi:MFS transporter, ACS family, D-galactonate transporter